MRHFSDISAIDSDQLRLIINDAHERKAQRQGKPRGALDDGAPLKDHTMGMLFELPSTRTRISFTIGMYQLGGRTIALSNNDIQLGYGESIEDTTRVLSRFVDLILIRSEKHETMQTMMQHSTVPVINGLTTQSHPCQIMAEVMTCEERGRKLDDTRWVWLGDGNNVAKSLIDASGAFGFELTVATPKGFAPCPEAVKAARDRGSRITLSNDPDAVVSADVVVTDTWLSMGQDDSAEKRKLIAPFQVNAQLLSKAAPDAMFMHCLPAHRGNEVTDDVLDGPQSAAWDEAENRLHVQKSIILWCLGLL